MNFWSGKIGDFEPTDRKHKPDAGGEIPSAEDLGGL
jgi:hypothetical protein